MPTALVTGATAGLGAEFARQLAGRGDDLVLVARDRARLDALAGELAATHGVRVEVLVADLAERTQVAQVADRLTDETNPIDLLVNNAGFGTTTSLDDPDTGQQERAIAVMAVAPLVLGAAAAAAMRARGRGRIVNVASLSAWNTQGGYSAVKAYTKVWSEGLAADLAGSGVTVTALCPGWVRTEFHQRAGLGASGIPGWVWVDAERCVRECLAHAEAGKVLSIPTKRWKVAAFVLQHAPRRFVYTVSARAARLRH